MSLVHMHSKNMATKLAHTVLWSTTT